MSLMIPRETIDQLRNYIDISLNGYGIDCTLYIPTNTTYSEAEKLDVFATPSDYNFLPYSAKVFIQWTPSIWRLKKLGLFTEGQIPILAYLPNKATVLDDSSAGSDVGDEVEVDIVQHSYIKLLPEYIPDDQKGVEEFEIVDLGLPNFHDAAITKIYKLTPRRVKQ